MGLTPGNLQNELNPLAIEEARDWKADPVRPFFLSVNHPNVCQSGALFIHHKVG